MIRVSELAKLAGVSLPTIKHYLNEGLIPRPVKTGKTMAYYDRSAVKRILLIKKLQQEKYMPLDVIKRVIDFAAEDEEELRLSEVIFRTDKLEADAPSVNEAYIERRTNYPLEKIRLLENEGIICPNVREDGKYYDAIDLELIEIMKRREEFGFPFDYSLDIVKIYFDAMKQAVNKAIRLFVSSVLDEAPVKKAVELLANHETSLDRYLILVRQKLARTFSQEAFKDFEFFSINLPLVSFLPLDHGELPANPPQGLRSKLIYMFLSGNFSSVMHLVENQRQKIKSLYAPVSITNDLARGDVNSALETTKQYIPFPTARHLDNATAALAYAFSMRESKGISDPLFYAKRTLLYLKRIEMTHDSDIIMELSSRYICGCIYAILPNIFDTHKRGIEILLQVESLIKATRPKNLKLPEWLSRTVVYEIFPAMLLRINRFLAYCYMRHDLNDEALSRLENIIETAEPASEFSEWARHEKLHLKKGRNSCRKS